MTHWGNVNEKLMLHRENELWVTFFIAKQKYLGLSNFLQNYTKGCCLLRHWVFPSVIIPYIKTSFPPNTGFSKSQKTDLTYTHWQPLCFNMPIMSPETEMSWAAHLKKLEMSYPSSVISYHLMKIFRPVFFWSDTRNLPSIYLTLSYDRNTNLYKL